ncbi:MAG: hypothetical protein WC444_04185 [Candidatus Paceibacterota bacterium]
MNKIIQRMGYRTEFRRWTYNTDRPLRGTRLRHIGKGRKGYRLVVRDPVTNEVLLDHTSSETYRSNSEVIEWIVKHGGTVT